MANVHEALQRAEEERQRAAGGKSSPPAVAASLPTSVGAGVGAGKRPRKKPVLDGGDVNKRRIALLQPDSFAVEQFRSLRSRIEALALQRPLHTIAMTSATDGEGKSLSAVNFALVCSMSVGSRVLLVDCDMRKPQVGNTFGLNPETGLAEVLSGAANLEQAISRIEDTNLDVLPVKSIPQNPSELLASKNMRLLCERLASAYDRVILDAPPILGLPDAKTLTELSDGMLLVVRAGQTPKEEVEAALETLDREKILGIVLNGVDQESDRYGYYY